MNPKTIICLTVAALISLGTANGQTAPKSPKDAVDIAVDAAKNAAKKSDDLKKSISIFGGIGVRKVLDNKKLVEDSLKETKAAAARASSSQERALLWNAYLHKRKEALEDAVSMIDRVLPKYNEMATEIQKVIGTFGQASAYIEKSDSSKLQLVSFVKDGKRIEGDIEFVQAELKDLDPASNDYFQKLSQLNKLKIQRKRMYLRAKLEKRKKAHYSKYIDAMNKYKDIAIKVRNNAQVTNLRLELSKESILVAIEMNNDDIKFNEFTKGVSEFGSVTTEIGHAVAALDELSNISGYDPVDFEPGEIGSEPTQSLDEKLDWDALLK